MERSMEHDVAGDGKTQDTRTQYRPMWTRYQIWLQNSPKMFPSIDPAPTPPGDRRQANGDRRQHSSHARFPLDAIVRVTIAEAGCSIKRSTLRHNRAVMRGLVRGSTLKCAAIDEDRLHTLTRMAGRASPAMTARLRCEVRFGLKVKIWFPLQREQMPRIVEASKWRASTCLRTPNDVM